MENNRLFLDKRVPSPLICISVKSYCYYSSCQKLSTLELKQNPVCE